MPRILGTLLLALALILGIAPNAVAEPIHVNARGHVQNIGWLDWVADSQTAGTTGRSLRMEAIRVTSDIPGWKIECRAHVQDVGWMSWVGDGQTCGTTGRSKRLEAVQLRLTHA